MTIHKKRARASEAMIKKMRDQAFVRGGVDVSNLPVALPICDGKRLVRVFVEGYEDVAFWRGIFDNFKN